IVNNMNEAMTRIRYELGSEAVIISQRKIRKPGFKGLFSPKIIEVTAAVENETNPPDIDVKESLEVIKRVVKENEVKNIRDSVINKENNNVESSNIKDKATINDDTLNLMSEMKQMKSMLSELAI